MVETIIQRFEMPNQAPEFQLERAYSHCIFVPFVMKVRTIRIAIKAVIIFQTQSLSDRYVIVIIVIIGMKSNLIAQGFQFLIHEKGDDTISMNMTDQLTYETFMIECHKLARIKAMTIEAAVRQESPHLKLKVVRRQKEVELVIIVCMDFIPQFQQKVVLSQVDANNYAIALNAVKTELKVLQNELNQKCDLPLIEVGNFDGASDGNERCRLKLKAGNYLIEGYGVGTSNSFDYGIDEIQEVKQESKQHLTINIRVVDGEVEPKQHLVCLSSNSKYGYEHPICFSKVIRLRNKGDVIISFNREGGQQTFVTLSTVLALPVTAM